MVKPSDLQSEDCEFDPRPQYKSNKIVIMEYNVKTAIEVITYGDFDVPYTKCVMVSDTQYNVKQIEKNFCNEIGVNQLSDISDNDSSLYVDMFIEHLKEMGFRVLKTKEIRI